MVAAGLALVSYWLFFSWARGGGAEHRLPGRPRSLLESPAAPWRVVRGDAPGSEAATGLEQPAAGGAVVEGFKVGPHQLGGDRQALGLADLHDA